MGKPITYAIADQEVDTPLLQWGYRLHATLGFNELCPNGKDVTEADHKYLKNAIMPLVRLIQHFPRAVVAMVMDGGVWNMSKKRYIWNTNIARI